MQKDSFYEFKQKYHIALNEQQETAVRTLEGPVLLLAVPGSGKTTVLVSRLGYMIFCQNISPRSILTVTYTVAATNDMRRRFERMFGSEYASMLEFRTINGISQKILQYFGRITGKEPFRVADKEALTIVKDVYHELTDSFATENDIKNIQTAITYVKNMLLNQEEIESLSVEVENFPAIYAQYNRELRNQCLIDYDDQMVYALKILKNYPAVLRHFQEEYRYFCVDEAQDTSRIQHEMIDLLAGESHNLFMVGDEDQSIYGFRAAYPQALVHFEQKHPGAKLLLMETNYRSREEIVAAADSLIQQNRSRHEKHMKAERPAGGKVTRIEAKSRSGQFYYLLKVAEDCDRETAVLYRNHESALPLIDMLERKGIPYRMKKNDMTFFSHPVVSDICDFLRLALDPCDTEAFLRIYYKMGAGISRIIAQTVAEESRGRKPLIDAIDDQSEISSFTRKQCRALAAHFAGMRGESAGKAIYRILHFMGYGDYMKERGMDEGKAQILKLLGDQEEDIRNFPARLDFLKELISNGGSKQESNFLLSTIHSSKGLEYDRVYMADMLTGILPVSDKEPVSREEIDTYEEERRLYYVGMTRAKNELYIFTFQPEMTSRFSRDIFQKKKDKPKSLPQDPDQLRKALEAYEMGVIVLHKNLGKGVVVDREGEVAEILFDREKRIRKIQLSFAIAAHLIRTMDEG